MVSLARFHGGLHLDSHKRLSSMLPPIEADVPERLVFPLSQRPGVTLEPTVQIGEAVARGQIIARGDGLAASPIHASSSGVVSEIRELPETHSIAGSSRCIVMATDGLDRTITLDPIADYRARSASDLLARIHQAGVVGLGGAVFPTAAKLDVLHPVDTLILNGAECEPYITSDDSLLRDRPAEVLQGAAILMSLLGAERCLLGIEDDMPEALAAVMNAERLSDVRGLEIIPVPSIYPTGGERQLTRVLTGRRVPAGGLPIDVGVLCHNVATAAAVYRAVVHGEPLTSRIVTVTGRGVRKPRNLWVRMGTAIADLIAQCGGYTHDAERLILGGPMMGRAIASDGFPVSPGVNCILVAAAGELPGRGPTRPCIRCGVCAEVCPEGLLPQQLHWYAGSSHLARAEELRLVDCIECGCCDAVCPSHIALTEQFKAAKSEIRAKRRERARADHARLRFEARQGRKEREERQRAEEAREKRDALQKPGAAEVAAAIQRARARKNAVRPDGRAAAEAHPGPDGGNAP